MHQTQTSFHDLWKRMAILRRRLLQQPGGETGGNVYVADRGYKRVLKLGAGLAIPIDLPFTSLNNPNGMAVDAAGNVYVTDEKNNRVVKLPAQ